MPAPSTGRAAARQREPAATLVGRTEELAALAQALTSPPAVAVLEGEAGIGKTRLVTELRQQPGSAVAGRRFVVGWCRRIREPFPLGPVIEAIRGVAGELASARLSPVAGALRPILPELAPWLPALPEPLDDQVAERHRVFRGLVEVLGAVGPAVLVLEDLHWADEHTIDFVSYLLADPPPELSLLLTFRGEDADPRVRVLTATPPAPVTCSQLVLGPLTPVETGALAASILGVEWVSEEFASYLCRRASGVPFAVEELVALMQARGVLVRRGGSWARKAIDELDVPAGIREPVLERFGRLSEPARAVAEAAAVLQLPAPPPVLLATCRDGEAAARAGLEAALESGLLAEQDEAIGFRHLLTAQAIYEAMPGPRRQQLHARAADALAAHGPAPLGQLAHHLRHAGRLDAWVDAVRRAADQADRFPHDDEAARLLEEVLRRAPLDPERRGRLAVQLGRAALRALYCGEEVVELLEEALAQELPRQVRGELRLRLGLLLERFGADFGRQRPLFAAAVDDLADQPELRAHAMVALGLPCVPGVPLAEHRAWLHRVLETVPEISDPVAQVFMLGKVAMVLTSVGDPQWRPVTERITARTGGAPRRQREVNAYCSVGLEACYAGHLPTADDLLAAGLVGAQECDSGQLEWRTRCAQALLDFCRGDWEGLAERAERLCDQLADYPGNRANAEVVACCLALAQGRLDRAEPWLDRVSEQLAQRGGFDLLPIPTSAQLRLAVGRGDIPRALRLVDDFLSTVESVPLVVSAVWALPALVEAMVAGDRRADAQALVDRWEEALSDLDAPVAPAAFAHARGFLAAGGEAAGHFADAAKAYERLDCRYQAAQAQEQAGSSRFAAGEPEAGAASLGAALAAYQRLGASWDLDRASRTARAHGVPVPARHRGGRRGYGPDLSPREREVAELAASGRTNKQIAQELFTSANTVKKHLTAAMRKLGVGSRTALAHRLAAGPGE